MWIKNGDMIELTCTDNVFFDGIIYDIVIIKKEENIEAAILLTQQKETKAEEFGAVVMPLSEISSINIKKNN